MVKSGFNSISRVIKIQLLRSNLESTFKICLIFPVFHFKNGVHCTEGRRAWLGNKILILKESLRISSCIFRNYNLNTWLRKIFLECSYEKVIEKNELKFPNILIRNLASFNMLLRKYILICSYPWLTDLHGFPNVFNFRFVTCIHNKSAVKNMKQRLYFYVIVINCGTKIEI